MRVFFGCTRARWMVEAMASAGVGRVMTPDARAVPGVDEPWGLDNGAFARWKRGEPWFPVEPFLAHVEWGLAQGSAPRWAVLPDLIAEGMRSLDFSLGWLGSGRLPRWPWYLAVQDGMEPGGVERAVRGTGVAGLFIGGSSAFKVETCERWVSVASAIGVPCHWGRASRLSWATHASEIGCGSCDTTQPLWDKRLFRRWLGNVRGGTWAPLQCRFSF